MKKVIFIVLSAFLLLEPLSAAYAQSNDISKLIGRINQLENQIQTMSRAVYRGETPAEQPAVTAPSGAVSKELAASFEVRLSALESQLRTLTGELEKLTYEVNTVKDTVERALADMDRRLTALEGGKPLLSSTGTSPNAGKQIAIPEIPQQDMNYRLSEMRGDNTARSADTMPTSTVKTLGTISRDPTVGQPGVPGQVVSKPPVATSAVVANLDTPEALYDHGFNQVREGDYDAAEGSFRQFLDAYPQHSLRANAQYWLAETFYVRNKFLHAAKLFAEGYKTYPKGAKASDNLLKLGMSLARINKTEDACLSFKQLEKEFPNTSGPVARRAEQEQKRLGCP